MTAPSPDAPDGARATEPPPGPPAPRRRWPVVLAVLIGVAVVIVLLGTVIRLPYVIYSPGDATPVDGHRRDLRREDLPQPGRGALPHRRGVARPPERLALAAGLARRRLRDRRARTASCRASPAARVDKENVVAMDDSQLAAKKVALEQLGYKVTESGEGAIVVQVVEGQPRGRPPGARRRDHRDRRAAGAPLGERSARSCGPSRSGRRSCSRSPATGRTRTEPITTRRRRSAAS